eukprot:NODE_118_length_18285_cov_1.016606.p2 type:complete len:1015 gc:universal NODE_118_length_18285_cov_1.016606:9968-6924(-)
MEISASSLEIVDWNKSERYEQVLKIRNDGKSSLRFIYYVVGKFFQTSAKYHGICFLSPGLSHKINLVFSSDTKQTITETLVIKAVNGGMKEVQLKAVTQVRKFEICNPVIDLGRVLAFRDNHFTLCVFNSEPTNVDCNVISNVVKQKTIILKAGINNLNLSYNIQEAGSFSENIEIVSEGCSQIFGIKGYSVIPSLECVIVPQIYKPKTKNMMVFKLQNSKDFDFEIQARFICKEIQLDVHTSLYINHKSSAFLEVPITPIYNNYDYFVSCMVKVNDLVIVDKVISIATAVPEIEILTEELVFLIDMEKQSYINNFFKIRNISDFPIYAVLHAPTNEIELPQIVELNPKEYRTINVKFSPLFPASYYFSIIVGIQGTSFQRLICFASAISSNNLMPFEALKYRPYHSTEIKFETRYLASRVITFIKNDSESDVFCRIPSKIQSYNFEITASHSSATIGSHSSLEINFAILSHEPIYQLVPINYELNGKLFYFNLAIYDISNLLENEKEYLNSSCGKFSWYYPDKHGLNLKSIPIVYNKSDLCLLENHLPISKIESYLLDGKGSDFSVEWNGQFLKFLSKKRNEIDLSVRFKVKNEENFLIVPNNTSLKVFQSLELPINFCLKYSTKDCIFVYVNNEYKLSIPVENSEIFMVCKAAYENIDEFSCVKHIKSQKLELDDTYIGKMVGIKFPIIVPNGVIVSSQVVQGSEILSSQYFESFQFDQEQKDSIKMMKDKELIYDFFKISDNYYICSNTISLSRLGSLSFKIIVTIKGALIFKELEIDLEISCKKYEINFNLLTNLFYPLQSIPADALSVKYSRQVSEPFRYELIKDFDGILVTNFHYLWLGSKMCGTSLNLPLMLNNKSSSKLSFICKSELLTPNQQLVEIEPCKVLNLVLNFSLPLVPKLFLAKIELIEGRWNKNIFIGCTAVSWADSKGLENYSLYNNLQTQYQTVHFQTLARMTTQYLISVLNVDDADVDCVQNYTYFSGTEKVELNFHFLTLLKELIDHLALTLLK